MKLNTCPVSNVHADAINISKFQIPGADTATIAAIAIADQTNGGRICGRVLSSAKSTLTTGTMTVCGKK